MWLVDDDPDALDVARANLAGIGRRAANVRIAEGSWFDALPAGTVVDVAVSNPPYVATDVARSRPAVQDWEPSHALFAGPDGLDAIRAWSPAPRMDPAGGWLVLEIGADQGPAVEALLRRGLRGRRDQARPRRPVDRVAVGPPPLI